jgi:hypothetical protein
LFLLNKNEVAHRQWLLRLYYICWMNQPFSSSTVARLCCTLCTPAVQHSTDREN